MEGIERVLTMLERTLNTKRKRHLAGGVLLSISLLFGGLAVTVITLKTEEIKDAEFEIM